MDCFGYVEVNDLTRNNKNYLNIEPNKILVVHFLVLIGDNPLFYLDTKKLEA